MLKSIFKVVVTGPESTGKTMLTEALAAALNIGWVPEFARYYIAHLGRPYERNDLKMIGLGQKNWEKWHTQLFSHSAEQQVLLCDTDWTVLQIWEQYRFQPEGDFEWQKGYGPYQNADLYLLCAPDFPWQPDPLREHPEEREILFSMYENLLREREARYIALSGKHETRLQTALAAIRELF